MKNCFKTLIAIMLVLMCIFACSSCGLFGDDTKDPDGQTPGGDSQTPDDGVVNVPPAVDSTTDVESKYRIRFVYSYTAKLVNENGRTENKKDVVNVKSFYIDVDNNGIPADIKSQIADLKYDGFAFEKWYTEWDKDTQTPVEGTEYDFNAPITADVTLYGYRGNLAGPNATWRFEYIYDEPTVVAVSDTEGEDNTTEEPEKVVKGIILHIEGTGPMFDFANANEIDVPWYKECGRITKIVVADGITTIGSNAFSTTGSNGFTKLKSLELPNTVTSIGEAAFKGLVVKKFVAPASLTYIGKNAFESTSLTEVILNEGLTTLGERAFFGSNKINFVLVPSTLKTIANSAFHPGMKNNSDPENHALSTGKVFYNGNADGFKKIEIQMDNAWFSERASRYYYIETPDNYGQEGAEVIIGNYWHYVPNTTIPVQYCYTISYIQGSTSIPFYQFFIPVAPQLDADGNVKYNEDGTAKLEGKITAQHVALQNSIVYDNFKFASFTSTPAIVQDAIITKDVLVTCNRGNILSPDGGIVFKFDSASHTLTISKDNTTKERIEKDIADRRASSCMILTDEEVAYLAAYLAGDGADAATIAAKVAEVQARNAADDGIVLTDEEATAIINARYAVAFKTFDFAESIDTNTIWTGKLAGLSSVHTLIIEDGVEYIGKFTFNGLSRITEVVLPASLKEIHPQAFSGCADLVTVYYSASIKTDCPTLDSLVDIRAKVHSYTSVAVAEDGNYWMIVDGARLAWSLNGDKLIIGGDNEMVGFASSELTPWYVVKDQITTVSFEKNIVALGENILNGFSKVTTLDLPGALRIIPASSIAGTGVINNTANYKKGLLVINGHLLKVDATMCNRFLFETYTGIITIAEGAFDNCTKIERIYIAGTIQKINAGAFDSCNIQYVFYDNNAEAWNSISSEAGLVDATVLYKSATRPTQTIYDDKGKPAGLAYVDGQHWFKSGNDYVVWGCMHVWSDWTVTLEPTCSTEGTSTRYCVYDKSHTEIQKIEKLTTHDEGEFVNDNNATCISNATQTKCCKVEGCTWFVTEEIPDSKLVGDDGLPKHSFTKYVPDNNFTCEANGTRTAICDVEGCGATEVKEDETAPMIGSHSYPDAWTYDEGSATCDNPWGTASRACNNIIGGGETCGHKQVEKLEAGDNRIPAGVVAQGHKNVEVADAKYFVSPATKEAPATYYKSCEWCGEASTETFSVGQRLNFYSYNDMTTLVDGSAPFADKNSFAVYNEVDPNGLYVKLTALSETNKALEIGVGKKDILSLVTLKNNNAKTTENTVHVLDTKFMLEKYNLVGEGENSYVFAVTLQNGSNAFVEIQMRKTADSTLKLVAIIGDTEYDMGALGNVALNAWYDLRVEYVDGAEKDTLNVTLKAENAEAKTFTTECTNTVSVAKFVYATVFFRSSNSTYVEDTKLLLDDTFIGTLDYTEIYVK